MQVERNLLLVLRHKNIVKLNLTFQDKDTLFFLEELLVGGELASQIAFMGVCPLDFAKYYAAQILVALEYLHGQRVAHRDIKPENCVLTRDGHLKVIDFDAALNVPPEGQQPEIPSGAIVSAIFGTLQYLPIEVILDKALPWQACAIDLWALGCVIFQMITGASPFSDQREAVTWQRIEQMDYVFPDFVPAGGPREVITALLSPKPETRLGHTSEGIDALKRHDFFGGSLAAFAQLEHRRPPHRGMQPEADDMAGGLNCIFSDGVGEKRYTPPRANQMIAKPVRGSFVESWCSLAFTMKEAYSESFMGSHLSFSAESLTAGVDGDEEKNDMEARRNSEPVRSLTLSLSRSISGSYRGNHMNYQKKLWKQRLQHILRPDEEVVMGGRVVQRLRLCRMRRVLILTSFPRLIIINNTATSDGISKIVRELDLTPRPSKRPLITVRGPENFVLRGRGFLVFCHDADNGAVQWAARISRQQQLFAKQSRSSLQSG